MIKKCNIAHSPLLLVSCVLLCGLCAADNPVVSAEGLEAPRYASDHRDGNGVGDSPCISAPSLTLNGTQPEAKWIWDSGQTNPRNYYLYVRKSFSLRHPVLQASAYVSAYAFAELYINGQHYDRIPVNPDPEFQTYDQIDLTPYLRQGTNTIAALVYNVGEGLHHRLDGRGGFFFQALVTDATGDVAEILSDDSWRVAQARAWDADTEYRQVDHCIGFRERYDARLAPQDWQQTSFDDSNWDHAVEIGVPPVAPWNRIVVIRRPRLLREIVEPVCAWDAQGYRIFDFGKEITAHPRFTVTADKAGIEMILGTGERLDADRLPTMTYNVDYTETYITKQGPQTWQPITWRGFRYLAIQKNPGIAMDSVGAEFRSYPVQRRGRFRCSDERLNQYWEIGRWTLQLCAHDTWMDTPWREQTQYIAGDTRYNMRYSAYAFAPDIKLLTDYNILSGAFSQRWNDAGAIRSRYPTGYHLGPKTSTYIPDYQLEWVLMLHEHYLYYADAALVKQVYPNLERLLAYFRTYVDNENGLLGRVPGWVVLDHPDTSPMDVEGHNTGVNCLYYGVLNGAAWLARHVMKDAPNADQWRRQAQAAKAAIQTHLWSDKDNAYKDGLESSRITQQTQVYALRYDLAPEDKKPQMVEFIKSQNRSCEQSFSYWLLYTMFAQGQGQWALDYMHANWGGQTQQDDFNGSWHEQWTPGGSTSHAWCSGPTALLPRQILGIAPLLPGWKQFTVAPNLLSLDWAQAVVPTIAGDIRVKAAKTPLPDGPTALSLDLTVPQNTVAQVHIPLTPAGRWILYANGRPIGGEGWTLLTDSRPIATDSSYTVTDLPDSDAITCVSLTDHAVILNAQPGTYRLYALPTP